MLDNREDMIDHFSFRDLCVILLFNRLYEGDEDKAIESSFRVLKKIQDYEHKQQLED